MRNGNEEEEKEDRRGKQMRNGNEEEEKEDRRGR